MLSVKERIEDSKKHAINLIAGDFIPENHFEPKTLCAKLNKVGKNFFDLSNELIIERYCALNPLVSRDVLAECLSYRTKYFKWAGCDLFNVTDGQGKRQMIIIENNTCPSGLLTIIILIFFLLKLTLKSSGFHSFFNYKFISIY